MSRENQDQGPTTEGMTLTHLFIILGTLGMLGLGIYLMSHFYEIHYPRELQGKALCDVNSFWTCDAATTSKISNIAGVPIALFGILFPLFLLTGSLFPSRTFERTHRFLLVFNFIGCIGLFLYSLSILGTLCPFCTIYYILSGIVMYLFFKKSNFSPNNFQPAPQILGVYALVAGLAFFGAKAYASKKDKEQSDVKSALIVEFDKIPLSPTPEYKSPFQVAEGSGAEILVFSDFQCPACKMLSEQLPMLARFFKGKLSIRYYFFPLDQACNKKMTMAMHPVACEAAGLAICSQDKFPEVHDKIFENQGSLNSEWLTKEATRLKIDPSCLKSDATKAVITSTLNEGERLQVQSTPTYYLEGRKIEGVLPLNQMKMLVEYVLEKKGLKP